MVEGARLRHPELGGDVLGPFRNEVGNDAHVDVLALVATDSAQLATFETVEGMPRGVSVRITATQEDGRKLTSQVDFPKGSIQNPMSSVDSRSTTCQGG